MTFMKKVKKVLSTRHVLGTKDLEDEFKHLLADKDSNGVPDIIEGGFSQAGSLFADTDGDGVPDIVQALGKSTSHFSSTQVELQTVDGKTTYCVNGTRYRSLDEMPLEHRALVEEIQSTPRHTRSSFLAENRSEILANGKPPVVRRPDPGKSAVSKPDRSDPYDERLAGSPTGFSPVIVTVFVFLLILVGIIAFLIGAAF